MLIFEVPTGAIADLYGRKFSVLLGLLIEGIAVFLIFFSTNFYIILVLLALGGFGASFMSGAQEAWTTDLINKYNKSLLQPFFKKRISFDSFALVISGLVGTFFVKHFGLPIIWFITGLSYFVSFFILLNGKEYYTKQKVKYSESVRKINSQSIKSINYARKHPVLFYFLLSSIVFVLAGGFGSEISWVPFLRELNLPDYSFGYLFSAMAAVGIFAPLLSTLFLKNNKEKKFLLVTMTLYALVLLPIIFVKNLAFAFLLLFPSLFFLFIARPIERAYFHKFIPSKLRATVGSVESMLLSIAAIIVIPLAGLSVDYLGAKVTIFLAAVFTIPAIIIFSRIKEKSP
jgi:MFS family permease